MMRVLVVAHGHPEHSLGGAENASHGLFRALDAADGVEAHFLARAHPPLQRHPTTPLMSQRQGPREIFLWADDYDHFMMSNGATGDLAGPLRRYLETVRPDVVHVHHFIGLGLEVLWEIRRTLPAARLVVTFHEYLPICANNGQMVTTGDGALCQRATPAACHRCFPDIPVARHLAREAFARGHLMLADAFVAPSTFLRDRYVAWGLPEERFHVIENGVEASRVAPARALPPGGRRSRFAFFGQFSPFKGLDVLLDAVARVPAAVWGEDARLGLFGGNLDHQPADFRERFRQRVAALGDRVVLHGRYRPDGLPDLMRQVDWVVVPSIWWENSPLVIQEAFLHGRPPIVSDIGGMREKVRDGIDGVHVRAGSADDLADTMASLLADPEAWERLRANAPSPAGIALVADRHLDLYRALADQPTTTPRVAAAPGRGRAARRRIA